MTENDQTMADFSAKIQSAKRNVDHLLVCIYEVWNQFQFVLSKTQLEKSVSVRTMKGFQKWRKCFFFTSKATVRENGKIVAHFSIEEFKVSNFQKVTKMAFLIKNNWARVITLLGLRLPFRTRFEITHSA